MRYEVISGFTMTVFDQSGKLMATADVSDTKISEQGAGLNMKVLQNLANVVLEEQMKKLFNTPDIKASLQRTTIQ
jgi:transcriptional regulator of acetoin/glycerol metabolism